MFQNVHATCMLSQTPFNFLIFVDPVYSKHLINEHKKKEKKTDECILESNLTIFAQLMANYQGHHELHRRAFHKLNQVRYNCKNTKYSSGKF